MLPFFAPVPSAAYTVPVPALERPKDYIHVTFPVRGGSITRAWSVTLPRASICVSLRNQLISTIGSAAEMIAVRIFNRDEDVIAGSDGIEIKPGDEAALDHILGLYRNARAGRALRGLAGYEKGSMIESLHVTNESTGVKSMRVVPGVGMVAATMALSAAMAWWLPKFGREIDAEKLWGRMENGNLETPGLMYNLLYASSLNLTLDTGGQDKEALNGMRDSGFVAWASHARRVPGLRRRAEPTRGLRCPAPLPPFLTRPHRYVPLPRAAGEGNQQPTKPRGLDYPAIMIRVAEKFGVSLRALDEWPIDVILEEADLLGYLFDLDNPPPKEKKTIPGFG